MYTACSPCLSRYCMCTQFACCLSVSVSVSVCLCLCLCLSVCLSVSLSLSLILMKIPASAACLYTYLNWPSQPVCRLPITRDRTRKSARVHIWPHTWTGGPPSPPKIGRHGHYCPRRHRCMPARFRLAMTCDKLAKAPILHLAEI